MGRKWYGLFVFLILLTAAALKAWLIGSGQIPFNADEAVVALMARHIIRGELPVFFYGQAYLGSLDALLVAGGFLLFGEKVWVIRFIQSLLYGGTIISTMALGKRVFQNRGTGLLGGLFLAIPTVNVALYTTASLGGYGEALLLGNLILLLGFRIGNIEGQARFSEGDRDWWMWFAWGLLVGFGLWVFGLTLVYSLPMGGYLLWKLLKKGSVQESLTAVSIILMGVIVGSMPWWAYAVQNGLNRLFLELTGNAIAGATQAPWALQPFVHFYHFLVLGLTVVMGMRPPWSVEWLMLPLAPLILVFWAGTGVVIFRNFYRKEKGLEGKIVLLGVIFATLAGFIFTSFGADPSGRYFLPFAPIMSLFAGEMIMAIGESQRMTAAGLVILVIVYHLGGIIQSARRSPYGLTTQFDEVARVDHRYDDELIKFLRKNDVRRGYSNYWVAYPLAFLSEEELIFTPQLPYHLDFRYTARDNRYQPYQKMVDKADSVGYITTNHPELNKYLRQAFRKRGLQWQEKKIGDYQIFYDLSQKIEPQAIGLGVTTDR